MFSLTTSIPHGTKGTSQGNQARKTNKRQTDWKEKNKPISIHRWDHLLYRKSKHFTKKPRTNKQVQEDGKTQDQYGKINFISTQ